MSFLTNISSNFLCYLAVAITCFVFSVIYLVGRFKSGNLLGSILIGKPQTVFHSLNVCAGVIAFFGSETLGSTKILETASANLHLAILQATGIALATFIGSRSTVSTELSSKEGQKIEIGPGKLFAVLLESIERRIDQERMVKASAEIKSIAPLLSPRAVLNVVLPYCFDQAENLTDNRKGITDTLEAIHNGKQSISPNERSALMLNHLHKIFGLSVLNSAIALVDEKIELSFPEGTVSGPSLTIVSSKDGIPPQNFVETTIKELDKLINHLSGEPKC